MPPVLILILLGLALICLLAEWTASSDAAARCAGCGYCKHKAEVARRPARCSICGQRIPPDGTCRRCGIEYWKDDD